MAPRRSLEKLSRRWRLAAGQLSRYFEGSRRRPEATGEDLLRQLEQRLDNVRVPEWLLADQQALSGRVAHRPERREIDVPADENRAVEFFAKF